MELKFDPKTQGWKAEGEDVARVQKMYLNSLYGKEAAASSDPSVGGSAADADVAAKAREAAAKATPTKADTPFEVDWNRIFFRKCAVVLGSPHVEFGAAMAGLTDHMLLGRDYREEVRKLKDAHAAEVAELKKPRRPAYTPPWWDKTREDRWMMFARYAGGRIADHVGLKHFKVKRMVDIGPEEALQALASHLKKKLPLRSGHWKSCRSKDFTRRVADLLGKSRTSLAKLDGHANGLSQLLYELDKALGIV